MKMRLIRYIKRLIGLRLFNRVKYKTSWTKEETEIELSDLAVNDMVSITIAGEIQETYPARIMNVIKVQLLGENLH